jgi:hypothetical protein
MEGLFPVESETPTTESQHDQDESAEKKELRFVVGDKTVRLVT